MVQGLWYSMTDITQSSLPFPNDAFTQRKQENWIEVAPSQDDDHQFIWQKEIIFWHLLLVFGHKRKNTTNQAGFDFYDLELLT